MPWVGVGLEPIRRGRPVVLAVHPDSPAHGTLAPGARNPLGRRCSHPHDRECGRRRAGSGRSPPAGRRTQRPEDVVPVAWPEPCFQPSYRSKETRRPLCRPWRRDHLRAPISSWTGAQCPSCEAALTCVGSGRRTSIPPAGPHRRWDVERVPGSVGRLRWVDGGRLRHRPHSAWWRWMRWDGSPGG